MSSSPPDNQRPFGPTSLVSPPSSDKQGGAEPKANAALPHSPMSPFDNAMTATGPPTSSSVTSHPSSSPPMSVAMTSQASNASVTNSFATPATSVTDNSHTTAKPEHDTQMTDTSPLQVQKDIPMTDSAYSRTDHEREEGEPKAFGRQQVLLEKPKPSDLTPLFKVGETAHSLSRPHPSQDLIQLYGLSNIAASVARKDLVTGEKINKLRKSYEGKIKSFGIAGRNKAISNPGELTGLLAWPDEEWHNQRVLGKAIPEAGFGAALEGHLEKALTMNAGKLPGSEGEKWRHMLAIEEPASKVKQVDTGKKGDKGKAPMPSDQVVSPTTGIARPQRTGKKRRYDDSSFEGYGDAGVEDFSSEEERLATATKKRRKKDFGGTASSPRNYSMGNMVGVSSSS